MTYLELCPACLRLAHDLVEEALDFTTVVTGGEFPRICEQHLPLVFSTLGYPTAATWLDHMLELREADPAAFAAMRCPLCAIEAQFTINDAEKASVYLCPGHGGGSAEVPDLIRHISRASRAASVSISSDLSSALHSCLMCLSAAPPPL